MTDYTTNLATIRKDGYSARANLSVYVGTKVAGGAITNAPDPAIVSTFHFLEVSYAFHDHTYVEFGMEVLLFSSGGAFKGRSHVRYGDAVTSIFIPIREFALASLNVVSGDLFEVWQDFRLHDKLVSADATFSPDLQQYSDQGANPPPLATSGGHFAQDVDGLGAAAVQTYASVRMVGSNSIVVDPDSTPGNLRHVWTLDSGSAFAPGSVFTDADPVLRCNVGEHLIYHTVTDLDNSKSVTQHVCGEIYDASQRPYAVTVESYDGDPISGFNFSIRALDSISEAQLPNGALCVLWVNETVGGVFQSFRNDASSRANILAVGYANVTHLSGQYPLQVLKFDVVSPQARMKAITSYSKVMIDSATPDAWDKLKTLAVLRGAIQIFQFYTTVVESGFDVVIGNFLDERYPALYLQRATFYDQLMELCNGVDSELTCEPSARFSLHLQPKFVPYDDRADLTDDVELTTTDLISWDMQAPQHVSVEQYKTSGFTAGASNNQPIFSLYPGAQPGEAVNTPTKDRLICVDQIDLNERTGRYGAFEDQVLYGDDGAFLGFAYSGTIRLRGAYMGLFNFNGRYKKLTLVGNQRSFDFNGVRWYPTRISVSFDAANLNATTTVTLQMETNALAGQTYTPPPPAVTYPPITPPQPPLLINPIPSSGLGRGTANLVLINLDSNDYYGNITLSTPAWAPFATGAGGTTVMFIVDAYSPKYLQTGSQVNGVLITTTQARSLTDLGGSPTLGTAHSFRFTSNQRSLQSERGVNGLFAAVSNESSTGQVDIEVSLDSGATWTRYTNVFGTWVGGAGNSAAPGCYVSARVSGRLYAGGYSGAGVVTGAIYVSSDYGATWARLNSFTFEQLARVIHIPFQNTSESLVYHGGSVIVGSDESHRLFKSTSSSQTDISPSDGTDVYGPVNEFGIKSCDVDQKSLLCVGTNWGSGHTIKWGVFLSRNSGVTWKMIIASGSSVAYRAGCFAGDDLQTIYLWGDGVLAVSNDGGLTFKDKSGNLAALSAGDNVNIVGL